MFKEVSSGRIYRSRLGYAVDKNAGSIASVARGRWAGGGKVANYVVAWPVAAFATN